MSNLIQSHLDILQELEIELDQLKPEQVEFRATKLEKPAKNDKPVGKLTNETMKRLWCLIALLGSRASHSKVQSNNATSAQEEKDKLASGARDFRLAELAKELFWTQLRRDFDLFTEDSVGIRADWQVVVPPEDRQDQLAKLLGGLI
jgi:hypothetical protein